MENEKIIWNISQNCTRPSKKQRPKSSICSPLSTFPKARSISFGYSWRIRSLFSCTPQRFRCRAKEIDDVFGHTLGISEKRALATLIYYPRERLEMEKKQQEDIDDWYKVMLYRLIDVCKIVLPNHPCQSAKALPWIMAISSRS